MIISKFYLNSILIFHMFYLPFSNVFACITKTNNVGEEMVRINHTDLDFLKIENFLDDVISFNKKNKLSNIGVQILSCYGDIKVELILNKEESINSPDIKITLERIFYIAKGYLKLNLAGTICTRSQSRMLLGCAIQYGLIRVNDKGNKIFADHTCKENVGLLSSPPNQNNFFYPLLYYNAVLIMNLSKIPTSLVYKNG